MRRSFLLLVVGFSLIATAAVADDVTVISAGEHGRYSRIAIAGLNQNVSASQDGKILRIRGLSKTAIFNLDDINKYKKAHRVTAARVVPTNDENYLELELTCKCQFKTKTSQNGKLILDISDISQGKADYISRSPEIGSKSKEKTDANVVFAKQNDDDRLTVEQAQDRMIALLKQAADEGLISMTGASAPTETETRSETEPGIGDREKSNLGAEQIRSNPRKIGADHQHTPPDRVTSPHIDDRKFSCINDDKLTIDGSKFENDPLYEIARLQTELAEAGRGVSKKFVEQIAVGFLSVGFGDEALALLTAHNLNDLPITSIAHIVSERPLEATGRFLGARNCTGAHALWQALADTPEHALDHANRANGALHSLPSRLKSLVTKRLAIKMADAKAWSKAEEYVLLAKEILPEDDPEIALVEAKLLAHHGDKTGARNALRQIAADGTAASPAALLTLADGYIEDEARTHDGFIEDIGGLAKIYGELRPSLIEAVAWADNKNFDAAMLILRNESGKSTDHKTEAIKTADRILTKGFSHPDDDVTIDALSAMLENRDWLGDDFWPIEKRNEVAQTITRLGLPNLALRLAGESTSATPEEILHLTEIALDAGEPETAIKIASPYSDRTEFAQIIVHSNIALKRYFAALATANNIRDAKTKYTLSADAAWAGRDWESASRAFKELSPNKMTLQHAINFALASYAGGEETLPPGAEAIIAMDAPDLADGIRSIFQDRGAGSPAERTGTLVDLTNKEIGFFEGILDDG